jgi:hypothetical protein
MNKEYSKIKKVWIAFSQVGVCLVLIVCSLQSHSAWAMGGMKPPSSDLNDAIARLGKTFILNPAVAAVQDEFLNAKTPLFTTEGGTAFTNAIALDQRYNCRIFYALGRQNALVQPDTNTWYQFKKYGALFLENKSFDENHRINYFLAHKIPEKPLEKNELWGANTESSYYEAIRVSNGGDLLVMSFSEKAMWARAALGIFNLDELATILLTAIQGLSMQLPFPYSVAGKVIDGLILAYAYCPKDPSPGFFLIGDDEEAFKFQMFEQQGKLIH